MFTKTDSLRSSNCKYMLNLTLPFSFLQRFDELLQLASKGQHTSVDMLVKDIYGGSYGSLGLTGDLIASSFGKSATADKGDIWPLWFCTVAL